MQAKPLQIGDQVGDHALEDALTLAQDVELRQKGRVKKTQPVVQAGALPASPLTPFIPPSQANLRGGPQTLTLSNISKSLALGWWMVQMMVRPPWAKDFMRDTTWKQEALSRPLSRERPPVGLVRWVGPSGGSVQGRETAVKG